MSSILKSMSQADFVKNAEYLASDVPFQAADYFSFRFTFYHSSLSICLTPVVIPNPDNHYSMNSGVCLAVATAVETVTIGFT